MEKIYLLRESIHNQNTETHKTQKAFKDKEKVEKQFTETYNKRVNEFTEDGYSLSHRIFDDTNYKGFFGIDENNEYNIWIEEIELE